MRTTTIRLGFGVLFCLGLSLALVACGSNSQACNGCGLHTTPAQQTFLIAAGEPNLQSSQLLSFPIDSTTGALGTPLSIAGPASPLQGSPLTALTAAGQGTPFVYVSPLSPDFPEQVYGYSVDATTGALTAIASSPFTAESSLGLNSGFALNSFLYLGAAAQLSGGLAPAVEAFSIGSDGSLSPSVAGSPFAIIPPGNSLGGNGPSLSSTAPYLYAAASSGLPGSSGGWRRLTSTSRRECSRRWRGRRFRPGRMALRGTSFSIHTVFFTSPSRIRQMGKTTLRDSRSTTAREH